LFQKQDGAEDALYLKRDAENAEAKRLRDEADRLWQAGERDKAKELHVKAKQHQEQARTWKQKAMDLDWKHNEEMFEYVQTREHSGQARDGTWIDLHGLSADFAVHKTLEALNAAVKRGLPTVEVITGAGHHSGKSGPVVKRRIKALLQNPPKGLEGLTFRAENDGSLLVSLPAATGFRKMFASWAPAPAAVDVEAQRGARVGAKDNTAPQAKNSEKRPLEDENPRPSKWRRLGWCCRRRFVSS